MGNTAVTYPPRLPEMNLATADPGGFLSRQRLDAEAVRAGLTTWMTHWSGGHSGYGSSVWYNLTVSSAASVACGYSLVVFGYPESKVRLGEEDRIDDMLDCAIWLGAAPLQRCGSVTIGSGFDGKRHCAGLDG
jgi:hypothetical protein